MHKIIFENNDPEGDNDILSVRHSIFFQIVIMFQLTPVFRFCAPYESFYLYQRKHTRARSSPIVMLPYKQVLNCIRLSLIFSSLAIFKVYNYNAMPSSIPELSVFFICFYSFNIRYFSKQNLSFSSALLVAKCEAFHNNT